MVPEAADRAVRGTSKSYELHITIGDTRMDGYIGHTLFPRLNVRLKSSAPLRLPLA